MTTATTLTLPAEEPVAARARQRADLVRVSVVEPHDLMAAGWSQLLEGGAGGRYRITGPDAPDVVLYGLRPTGHEGTHDLRLHELLRRTDSKVIATHWDDTPALVDAAMRCGAHGSLSKRLPREDLVTGLETILRAEGPVRCPAPQDACHPEIARTGLSPRELEVLCLVAQGLTNDEIADRLYVTINTIKTYIRYGYRKIGAERRSHAVIWVQRHGLAGPAPA